MRERKRRKDKYMRSPLTRVWLLVAACGALGACGGGANYAAASCSAPGAVRESPFNSTANPTEGPLPRAPGDIPCYIPGNDAQPSIASTGNRQRAIASDESAGSTGPR
jgi:hypothetical protein